MVVDFWPEGTPRPSLRALAAEARAGYAERLKRPAEDVDRDMEAFLLDRLRYLLSSRGFPGDEVEAVLGAHPSARQAAVIVRDDARLGKTLRAYVELHPEADDPGDRALRVFLAERLPPYMVPEKVITLRELPRTSTGKVDYRALG